MALRIEKTIGTVLMWWVFCVPATAQLAPLEVRHTHVRKGGSGELRFGETSIVFEEKGKLRQHSAEWKYEDIQQLTLSEDRLSIRTYDDVHWQLGRDRRYEFDSFPQERVIGIYRFLRQKMDQRFVAAIAEPDSPPVWQVKAKLAHGLSGSQGTVLVGRDQIIYRSEQPGESRTWAMHDIDNVSSSGPFDLVVTAFEQSASAYGNRREFRFQLKEALPVSRYQALWERIAFKETHHD